MSSEETVHVSHIEITLTSGQGTLGTWWFLRQVRARLDKTEHINRSQGQGRDTLCPTLVSEPRGNYCSECLTRSVRRRAAMFKRGNRTLEKSAASAIPKRQVANEPGASSVPFKQAAQAATC